MYSKGSEAFIFINFVQREAKFLLRVRGQIGKPNFGEAFTWRKVRRFRELRRTGLMGLHQYMKGTCFTCVRQLLCRHCQCVGARCSAPGANDLLRGRTVGLHGQE